MHQSRTHRFGETLIATLLAGMFVLCGRQPVHAQRLNLRVPTTSTPEIDPANPFPFAAPLNANTDHDRMLGHIQQALADEKLAEAVEYISHLLTKAKHKLASKPSAIQVTFLNNKYGQYQRFAHVIEQVVRTSPALLAAYRIRADAQVLGILSGSDSLGSNPAKRRRRIRQLIATADDATLQRLTDEFFLSTFGDEVATRLARSRFDRGEFSGAVVLLNRVLTEYPRPNVNINNLRRLAAAAEALIGKRKASLKRLEELPPKLAKELAPRIHHTLARSTASSRSNNMDSAFENQTFASSREQLNRLPARGPGWSSETQLTSGWRLAPSIPAGHFPTIYSRSTRLGLNPTRRSAMPSGTSTSLWKTHHWMPSANAVLRGEFAYWKSNGGFHAVQMDSGVAPVNSRQSPYSADPLSQSLFHYGTGSNLPRSPADVQSFGDRIDRLINTDDQFIYVIESRLKSYQPTNFYLRNASRHRSNRLAAYPFGSNKPAWIRPAAAESADDLGILGPPVSRGQRLYVPVSHQSELWLYALNRQDGQTIWRTFLCDESRGFSHPWAPVGVATADSDVFVATGSGVVLALDSSTGTTRWATRYLRPSQRNIGNPRRPTEISMRTDGWTEDTLIPFDNSVVVVPSDSRDMFALNRSDGSLKWDSTHVGVDGDVNDESDGTTYVLGVDKGLLYLAGPKVVRQYGLRSGLRLAERWLEDVSFGRGVICDDGIYIPLTDSIVRIDTASPTLEVSGTFRSVRDIDEPIGNLFASDGVMLAAGANHLERLVNLDSHLEQLAARAELGHVDALIGMARIELAVGRTDKGLEHAAGAHDLLVERLERGKASAMVVAVLNDFDLAKTRPVWTLDLLAKNDRLRNSRAGDNTTNEDAQRLTSITNQAFDRLVSEAELDASDRLQGLQKCDVLLSEPDRFVRAKSVVRRESTLASLPVLLSMSEGRTDAVRLLGIAGLGELKGKQTDEALIRLEDHNGGFDVQFEAALKMVNRGRSQSLHSLVKLLNGGLMHYYAAKALTLATGQSFGELESKHAKPAPQAEVRKRWTTWLNQNVDTLQMKLPVDPRAGERTLITCTKQNRVFAMDSQGQLTWELQVETPTYAEGLGNGNRLVCSDSGKFVAEYDAKLNLVWKLQLTERPHRAHRLKNGNTLVISRHDHVVFEVSPDRKEIWRLPFGPYPADAAIAENGDIWVAIGNKNVVARHDKTGKVLAKFTSTDPRSLQLLADGQLLVSQPTHNRVDEVSSDADFPNGRIEKTFNSKFCKGLESPIHAERLKSGNTLIVDQTQVREFTPDGKVVWLYKFDKQNQAVSATRF